MPTTFTSPDGTPLNSIIFDKCQAALSPRRETRHVAEIGELEFFFGVCTDVQWAQIPDMPISPRGTTRLTIPAVHRDRAYYSLQAHPKWRCVVLDTFDLSVEGVDPDSVEARSLLATMQEKTRFQQGNQGPHSSKDYNVDARWGPWNGGVGSVQLAWLQEELAQAKRAQQRVLVFGHCPFHPAVVGPRTASLMWNYPQVLKVVQQSGNVVATFTGHVHQQGAHTDEFGVQHYTLPAIVETPNSQSACHGVVYVGTEGLIMEGTGDFRTEKVVKFGGAQNGSRCR